jgi:hypothetical protein
VGCLFAPLGERLFFGVHKTYCILYLIPLWLFWIIFCQFSVNGSGENISSGGAELFFLDHKEKLDVTECVCLDLASLTTYESRLL